MFDNGNNKRGNINYNPKTNLEIAVRKAFDSGGEVIKKVREVAFLLRKEIISSKKRSLPATITLPDIYRGEMDTPPILHEFLGHLIVGYKSKTKSDIKRRRIE